MSKNENPTSDKDHVEKTVRSATSSTTVFSDGSTYNPSEGYSSNGAPVRGRNDPPAKIVKTHQFFTPYNMAMWFAGMMTVLLVGVSVLAFLVGSAQKEQNETILEGIKDAGTPVEIVDTIYANGSNNPYERLDKVVVRFEDGQITPCDITVAQDGDTTKTFVECSGAVLVLDEPKEDKK